MALTATASDQLRTKIKQHLHISNCKELVDNPDRPNIKLFVKKVSNSENVNLAFAWLKNYIAEHNDRQLIFCKSIADTSRLYNFMRGSGAIDMSRVEMFHSMTPKDVKDDITKDMANADGRIRILFCTSAAGMGVNFKGVSTITSYGPPQDMDTFVQHIGRAGRDGNQSVHLLLYHARQVRNCDTHMRLYVKNSESCRREMLLEPYCASPCGQRDRTLCCDSDEVGLVHPALDNAISDEESEEEEGELFVTKDDKATIRSLLDVYHESSATTPGRYDHLNSPTASFKVIDQVIDRLKKLVSATAILENTDVFDIKVAKDIFGIICDVLGRDEAGDSDIESDDE